MANVLEMLHTGCLYRYLFQCDTQRLDEVHRVMVSPARRSKAGHRDTDYPFAGNIQFVKGHDSDQQRQRGIESSGNADNRCLRMRMHQSFRQSCHLYLENLFTTVVQFFPLRSKWERIDRACQGVHLFPCILRQFKFQLESALGVRLVHSRCEVVGNHPVMTQILHIYFGNNQLVIQRETFGFCQYRPVLCYQGTSGKDKVGRGFPEAG